MIKRIVSLVLCALMFVSMFTLTVAASASERNVYASEAVQPRLTYIQSATTNCTISGGKVNFMVDVICYPSASSCKAVAKIYRRPAGSSNSWTYLGTYTDTGTDYALVTGSKTAVSGYEYRVQASVTAYTSSGTSETSTFYSKIAK